MLHSTRALQPEQRAAIKRLASCGVKGAHPMRWSWARAEARVEDPWSARGRRGNMARQRGRLPMGATQVQCQGCGNTIDGNATTCSACGNAVPQGNVAPTGTTARGYGATTQSFDCQGCGAQTVFSATKMTMECPYCGSQKVIQLPP